LDWDLLYTTKNSLPNAYINFGDQTATAHKLLSRQLAAEHLVSPLADFLTSKDDKMSFHISRQVWLSLTILVLLATACLVPQIVTQTVPAKSTTAPPATQTVPVVTVQAEVNTPPTPTSTRQCRIAYSEKTGTNINDIYVTDCDGSNRCWVTEGRISTGHEPAWSPDGQRLVFDENQNLEFDTVPAYLYIINADGTNRTQIVAPDSPAEGDFPVWSPDGSRIAWEYGCEIMTIRPDGSDIVTVLAHRELSGAGDPEMCANRPMWSPDSQRFAFTTFPLAAHHDPTIPGPYEYRFYVVNADGTGLTELVSFQLAYPQLGGVADVNVFWLPNGRQVALEVSEGERTQRYQMNADRSGEMVEIDSIPESWRPWYWPQWDKGR